jgi:signal transduction histidine kinase
VRADRICRHLERATAIFACWARAGRRACRHVGAVLVMAMAMAMGTAATQAEVLTLTEARVTATVKGVVSQTPVTLPYDWDARQGAVPGSAVLELHFALPAVLSQPYGLYVSRLGTAYELWLNGVLLQKNGSLLEADGADYAKAPRFVVISPASLHADNVLQVRLRADASRKAGLAPVVLGPEQEVKALYLRDYRIRNTGSLVVLVFSLTVGFIALMLWVSQRIVDDQNATRRESLFLWAAIAELCWSVSIANHLIEVPPLPSPWWAMIAAAATAAWACSMALFCMDLAHWQPFREKKLVPRWFAFLVFAGLVAFYAAATFGMARLLTLWYLVLGLTFLVFVPFFVLRALRGTSTMAKLLAICMVINMLVACYDLYVLRLSPSYGAHTFLRYSSVLFGLSLGYFVLRRFYEMGRQAQVLNLGLAERVAEKEAELALSFAHLERFAREQERLAERGRIWSEMHDGVGARIGLAIQQLKTGHAVMPQTHQTLRASLEELKLTIDAMGLPEGDVTAMLASLRYRLEPRIRAAGIELHWEVQWLPILDRLDGSRMRHLQVSVYEALSNVLLHSGARSVRVVACEAGVEGRGISIQIIDDGCGFDWQHEQGRGLLSMQERSARAGASLIIDSAPGRTRVEFTLE